MFHGITKWCESHLLLVLSKITFARWFFLNSIPVNPKRAPKTKRMQVMTQAEMEVSPSTLGEFVVMLVKMLINTRKRVTNKVILPGTISGGIKKLAYRKKEIILHFNTKARPCNQFLLLSYERLVSNRHRKIQLWVKYLALLSSYLAYVSTQYQVKIY